MIVTVGTCVECYTSYATEMHESGHSDVVFRFASIDESDTHLAAMHEAGTPHSMTPTLLYQEDE